MTLDDEIAELNRLAGEAYKELRAIPWWHFREQNRVARKYNNLRSQKLQLIWDRPRPMITVRIWFTDGTYQEVVGYNQRAENGLLQIQTSNRQGGAESYEYYPLTSVKKWSV